MKAQSYWNNRIERTGRYKGVGINSYPEQINRYRKEKAKEVIEEALADHAVTLGGNKVLDAGCGTGIYSEFYNTKGADVSGFDFAESAINDIKQRGLEGNFSIQKLSDLSYDDEQFDLSHCFSVLYHVLDDTEWESSIRELSRVTRYGGNLLLRIEWKSSSHQPADHVKYRAWNQYKNIFHDFGLAVVDTYKINDQLRFPPISRRVPTLATALHLFQENSTERIVLLEK